MDSPARVESCRLLVNNAHSAGCSVRILDTNFQEAKGIITRAASWARSEDYDIAKANKVSAYLHDSDMSDEEVLELPQQIEETLNTDYHILVKTTNYDVYENIFQEDEASLLRLIEDEYRKNEQKLLEEKLQSIRVDVRSIIMVYRERKGQVSTTINESSHIMLTLNNAVAIASKTFEDKNSINSGHVPACITADLFGAILWLSTPATLMEYKQLQLLADCYSAMQPSTTMLRKYIESLKLARNAGDIDEKKFIFLRSHPVARDALMSITKGDYSKFTQKTYQEVYDEILSRSEKKYNDERELHDESKKKLLELEVENKKREEEIEVLKDVVRQNTELVFNLRQFEIRRRSNFYSKGITILVASMPIIILIGLLEYFKTKLIVPKLSTFVAVGIFTVFETLIIASFKKIQSWLYKIFESKFRKQQIP